ncbi:MAG: nickel-dependent hydrogenase large subunit [Candidatus Methanomethylicia archaeon]
MIILIEKTLSPFNRVEGDLDIKLTFDGKKVVDIKIISSLFRGIENILINKKPLDALVITPRVCGICGASHLYASASALDMIYNAEVPENGWVIRNILAISEICQNDLRHHYLYFLIDLTNKKYNKLPFYEDIKNRWGQLVGNSYRKCIVWSKRYTEIYAILGGQWPHGSAIVPGGVTTDPYPNDFIKIKGILKNIISQFIEPVLLGGPLEQFLNTVRNVKDLDQWAHDYPSGDLSRFWIYGQEIGLDRLGRGSDYLISYGHFKAGDEKLYFQSGIYSIIDKTKYQFDQRNLKEYITKSFYEGDNKVGKHPFEGETLPLDPENGKSLGKYTFTKTARYELNGKIIAPEVGALAMMTNADDQLTLSLLDTFGPTVLVRVLARIIRFLKINDILLKEIDRFKFGEPTFKKYNDVKDGRGYGLVEAARGALGHWIEIKNGIIKNYQIVTPTQINMGPEDPYGNLSSAQKAVLGTEVEDVNNPIEVSHIIRSYDACLVCTVH